MVPEDEAVLNVHHVGRVGLVLPRQLLQYRDIPLGLLENPLLVPDDLEGRVLFCLVVIDLGDLAEGAPAQEESKVGEQTERIRNRLVLVQIYESRWEL